MSRARQPGEDDTPLDLTALDGDFAAAPLPSRSGAVPDGHYHVQVAHVEITTTRTSGRPILKWQLRICGPAYYGCSLWKTSHLSTLATLRWLKHDLDLCGLELDKLSDLPGQLHRLLTVELDVTKRSQGEWENVYFNRRLHPDSDIPF